LAFIKKTFIVVIQHVFKHKIQNGVYLEAITVVKRS